MGKENETTTKFKVDITELREGMQEAGRQIRLANSEFKNASSGMDNWAKSSDGINAKLKQLKTTLSAQDKILGGLEDQYRAVCDEQGETSRGAEELKIKINNQKAVINGTIKSIGGYEKSLEDVASESNEVKKASERAEKGIGDVADSAEKGEKSLGGFASKLGSIAKVGLGTVAGAVGGVITAFLGSAEASREWNNDMAKLEQNAKTSGNSFDMMKKKLSEVTALTGEADSSIEALSNIMATNFSDLDASKAIDALSGAVIKFPDTLKIESLADSLQETIKTGAGTGQFGELIERSGASLEDFNASMANCSTEAERQQVALEWLSQSGLTKINEEYQKTNKTLLDSEKAQFALTDSIAQVGMVATPIMSILKNFGASILTDLLPNVKELGAGFLGMADGVSGSTDKVGGAITNVITGLLGNIAAMLPQVMETGVNIIGSLANGLISAIPKMATAALSILSTVIESIPQIIATRIDIIKNISSGLAEGIPQLVTKGLDLLDSFANVLTENAPKLIQAGLGMLKNLVTGIVNSIPTLIERVPEIITKFANIINDNAPTILKEGMNMILTIIKGIISAIPVLIKNIPKIITAIIAVWEAFNWLDLGKKAIKFLGDGILGMVGMAKNAITAIKDGIINVVKNLPQNLIEFGKNGISGLASGIGSMASSVLSAIGNIVSSIFNTISNLPSKMLDIGINIVKGLWNGIGDMAGWIIDKVKGFGSSVMSGLKSFFNIHSPSKLLETEIGYNIVYGLGKGIEKKTKFAVDSAKSLARKTFEPLQEITTAGNSISKATEKYNVPSGARAGTTNNQTTYNFNQTNNSPKALSRLELYRQSKNLVHAI